MQRKLTRLRDKIEAQPVNISQISEPEALNTDQASQPQPSQSSIPQTDNVVPDIFDDLPDSIFASLPDFQTSQISNNVSDINSEKHADKSGPKLNGPRMFNGPRMLNVPRPINGPRMLNVPRPSNGPRMLNVPKVKKRSSSRLRKLKTKKIKGPGASADEPYEIQDETVAVVMPTQESAVANQ